MNSPSVVTSLPFGDDGAPRRELEPELVKEK
jgi:hypothetical protein